MCTHTHTHNERKDKHTIKVNKSVLGCSGEQRFKTLFLLSLLDTQHLGFQLLSSSAVCVYMHARVCACIGPPSVHVSLEHN